METPTKSPRRIVAGICGLCWITTSLKNFVQQRTAENVIWKEQIRAGEELRTTTKLVESMLARFNGV